MIHKQALFFIAKTENRTSQTIKARFLSPFFMFYVSTLSLSKNAPSLENTQNHPSNSGWVSSHLWLIKSHFWLIFGFSVSLYSHNNSMGQKYSQKSREIKYWFEIFDIQRFLFLTKKITPRTKVLDTTLEILYRTKYS